MVARTLKRLCLLCLCLSCKLTSLEYYPILNVKTSKAKVSFVLNVKTSKAKVSFVPHSIFQLSYLYFIFYMVVIYLKCVPLAIYRISTLSLAIYKFHSPFQTWGTYKTSTLSLVI